MKQRIKVENNTIIPENIDKWEDWLAKVDGLGFIEIDIPKTASELRTTQQNKLIHAYCEKYAQHLNNHGQSLFIFFSKPFELWWSMYMVKDILWRTTQRIILGKESTTELKRNEVSKVIERMDQALIERGLDPLGRNNEY